MLRRVVTEREQHVAFCDQRGDRFFVFYTAGLNGEVETGICLSLGLWLSDVLQMALDLH